MPTLSGSSELLDAEYVLSHLGLMAGMTMAELGCGGRGHFVFPAAKFVGSTGQVYAVDIIKPVLSAVRSKAAEERFPNVLTIWSDIEKVGRAGIDSGTVDRVTIINVLFQSSHPEAILEGARRLLKNDGRLLVVDWLPAVESDGPAHVFGPSEARRWGAHKVRSLAAPLGFQEIKSFNAGQHHYGLIFEVI